MSAENILRLQVTVSYSCSKKILIKIYQDIFFFILPTFFVEKLQSEGQILDDKTGFKFSKLAAIFNVVEKLPWKSNFKIQHLTQEKYILSILTDNAQYNIIYAEKAEKTGSEIDGKVKAAKILPLRWLWKSLT